MYYPANVPAIVELYPAANSPIPHMYIPDFPNYLDNVSPAFSKLTSSYNAIN